MTTITFGRTPLPLTTWEGDVDALIDLIIAHLTATVEHDVINAPSNTVGGLPPSPVLGQFACVTDGGAALAWGATVTGGGSAKYMVWYNGTNWTVIGK